MTRWWATGLVAVMALLAGCGGGTDGAPVAGSSTTSVTATPAERGPWDPCTIPDDAVQAAGLDVGSKTTNLFGDAPLSNDWKTCFWKNPFPRSWYFLSIMSSALTMDTLQNAGPFQQFTPVADSDGLQFRRTAEYDEVSCGIAFSVTRGVVYMLLEGDAISEPAGDPCVEVERVARVLRPSIPPANN